jgi:serine phosphatase RsbU (regulator of sigma subunit)
MFAMTKQISKVIKAHLSQRIMAWVFASVIIIETIIFVPSYYNRRAELLQQLKEVSLVKVAVLRQFPKEDPSPASFLEQVSRLSHNSSILGGTLYSSNGAQLGSFGEKPQLTYNTGPSKERLFHGIGRYDIICPLTDEGDNLLLILRHDTAKVQQQLNAFILRIAGLVIIISLFVTVGAWIALRPIVVDPILKLRRDLLSAGDAIKQDKDAPVFYSAAIERHDELGEVISAFKQMYQKITETIRQRKEAEASLQKSLLQVEAYSKTLRTELEQGRKMQTNFLPSQMPDLDGWEFSAYFKPARQVAGDFYDVFPLNGGCTGLVVADVCDKGVGAALFMALVRSLIRIFSGQTDLKGVNLPGSDSCPKPNTLPVENASNACHLGALEAVRLTSNYIYQNHGELAMFATLFFGILDIHSGQLAYINAGHESAYVIDRGGIKTYLKANSPAVGIMPDATFAISQTTINPGDIFISYTDGITEARSPQGEFFTRARLQSLLQEPADSALQLIEHIHLRLHQFVQDLPQEDDLTLLAVRRRESPDSSAL